MPAPSSRRFPRPSPLRAALPQTVRLSQKLQRLAARSLDYPDYLVAIERVVDDFLARIAAEDRTRRRLARAVHTGLAVAVALVV